MRYIAFLLLMIHAAASAQTTLTRSFTHGSITREYRIYIPSSYSSSVAAPLILNLHGYGSDMYEQEVYGDFRAVADTAGFIVVHPNGTFDTSLKRYWNAYGMSTVDDLGFLSTLIDTVKNAYNIDHNRVYSAGLSNGAIMSYYLACELSGKIAAIASVAGSMTTAMNNGCSANHPTPVMEIHGTADAIVPYNGSSVFMHTDSIVKFWRNYNNCSNTPVVTNVPNTNTSDGCTATRYDYISGSGGSKVALYKITGGGHSWPGAPVLIDVTNYDFHAGSEIWRFFRPFRLNTLSSAQNIESRKPELYPNPVVSGFNYVASEPGSMQIHDIHGRCVKMIRITEGTNVINIEELQPGVYIVSCTEGQDIFIDKILKQ